MSKFALLFAHTHRDTHRVTICFAKIN